MEITISKLEVRKKEIVTVNDLEMYDMVQFKHTVQINNVTPLWSDVCIVINITRNEDKGECKIELHNFEYGNNLPLIDDLESSMAHYAYEFRVIDKIDLLHAIENKMELDDYRKIL